MRPNRIMSMSLETVNLEALGQKVTSSRSGGKTRARKELLTAPTSEMKRSNFGMRAAKKT